MRNRGALLLALVIAALLAAGSAYALVNAGDDSGPQLTALPTASPSPTATATPSATPTETPTQTATASPTATATSSPTATKTTAKPTTTSYSYPRPTHSYAGLELTLSSNNNNEPAGSDFVLTAKTSDGDGVIFFNGLEWGDGSSEPAASNPQHCKSFPTPTSPQGAYQPQPDSKTFTFHHSYVEGERDYVITVHVASVNGDCRPHGPVREDTTLRLRIHVNAPEPTP